MKIIILTIFLSSPLFAMNQNKYNKALDVMVHEYPGCPINSYCSEDSGKLILKWEKMINSISPKNKHKKLKAFLSEQGLPVEFLTTKESKVPLDPVSWNSRCKIHNPKNPNNNIFKAFKFFNNSPKSKHTIFTPVTLYDGVKKINFEIPYQDQIVLIKNNQAVLLKDYDDFYYQLGITPDGKYSIVNLPYKVVKKALSKKIKEVKCPDKMDIDNKYFAKTFCQKVLDLDTNTLKTIQYGWSCP